MFGNLIDPIKNKRELILSHHTISSVYFDNLNLNEKIVLFTICIALVYLVIKVIVNYRKSKYKIKVIEF